MAYDREKHHRRSIRLRQFDYTSPKAYFVTLCTDDRRFTFGRVTKSEIHLSKIGRIVAEEWLRSPDVRPEIQLDEWIVMPNHLHGIVVITASGSGHETLIPPITRPSRSLYRKPRSSSSFLGGLKATVTRRVNVFRGTPGAPVWQRNFYEHIIRDKRGLKDIRKYIIENPLNWDTDPLNPRGRPNEQTQPWDI